MPTAAQSLPEFVAMRQLGLPIDLVFVDWAVRLMVEGHDTHSLRLLAGETHPQDRDDIGSLVDRVLEELGCTWYPSLEAAAMALVRIRATQVLANSISRKAALLELKGVCIDLGYPDYLYDFYLLYWALDDLEELGEQYYWPGADRSNIHDVIDERFAAWT